MFDRASSPGATEQNLQQAWGRGADEPTTGPEDTVPCDVLGFHGAVLMPMHGQMGSQGTEVFTGLSNATQLKHRAGVISSPSLSPLRVTPCPSGAHDLAGVVVRDGRSQVPVTRRCDIQVGRSHTTFQVASRRTCG